MHIIIVDFGQTCACVRIPMPCNYCAGNIFDTFSGKKPLADIASGILQPNCIIVLLFAQSQTDLQNIVNFASHYRLGNNWKLNPHQMPDTNELSGDVKKDQFQKYLTKTQLTIVRRNEILFFCRFVT